MSANIYWEPANRPAVDVPVSAPQAFMRTLEHLGWQKHDDILTEEDLPALRALAEVQPYAEEKRNPYTMLVQAIEKHGRIRVWAVY